MRANKNQLSVIVQDYIFVKMSTLFCKHTSYLHVHVYGTTLAKIIHALFNNNLYYKRPLI